MIDGGNRLSVTYSYKFKAYLLVEQCLMLGHSHNSCIIRVGDASTCVDRILEANIRLKWSLKTTLT